jgi:NAD(P)-dependent dehydrogenase (short-subunit alcohol dehydrogenase family)
LSTDHNSRRWAIVTGAASGIGAAVALRLASDGRGVVLADVDAGGLERTAGAIRERGGRAEVVVADLASAEGCGAVVRAAREAGPLDALVNVAGIMCAHDSVEDLADADLERLFAVNVMAIFRLGRHAIRELRGNGGGVIVNTTSVHAFATMDHCAAYAASKGAIQALTRQMAIDLAPDGIRVVAVAPGSVDTPLTRSELQRRGQSADEAGFAADPRALGRVCRPEEIAEVVAWLASSGAGVVNGSTLAADAGLLAKLV